MDTNKNGYVWKVLLAALCMLVIAGCAQTPEEKALDERVQRRTEAKRRLYPNGAPPQKKYSLTVYGYNYTDQAIGYFSIDSAGGGDLSVSTPTTGGGKYVCCIGVFMPILEPEKFTVKWVRDGDLWCEQDVYLQPLQPLDAEYLEVHFYHDGHIELAATHEPSPLRVKLERANSGWRYEDRSKAVYNDTKFSRCKHGYK